MGRRRKATGRFRDIHGILLLDKPLGMSSNAALQQARRLIGAAKGGHTGSLDPLASGLLPLCFGEATKLATSLLGARKAYRAQCRLGLTTSSGDLEGEVTAQRPVRALDATALEAALAQFRGRIRQTPPRYSAIKQGGEPLYLKARRGESVEVPVREVLIHRLELLDRRHDVLELEVECGSGTYIRSLAVDLGEWLGCGAHLTALRRLWVEPFCEPAMVTLEQLAQAPDPQALLLPVAAGVARWPVIVLDDDQDLAVRQGRALAVEPDALPVGECAAFAPDGNLLALMEHDGAGQLRVRRGFNLPGD